jgi:hypothetical protein
MEQEEEVTDMEMDIDCDQTQIYFDEDPILQINEDLHDLILQHISGTACTEVSNEWNQITTNSKTFLKNVKLDLIGKPQTLEELNFILNTDRKYSNISFDNRNEKLFIPKCKILEKFSESITNLTIGEIHFAGEIFNHILMPNLKSLTITHRSCVALATRLLQTSKKITKLVQTTFMPWPNDKILFIQILANQIKHLECEASLVFYLSTITNLKGILETLKVTWAENSAFFMALDPFLTSQSNSLRKLSTERIFNDSNLKRIIESLAKLEFLEIGKCKMTSFDTFKDYDKKNSTIKTLKLHSFSIDLMKIVLNAMPRLEGLHILWATEIELTAIVTNSASLKKIFMKQNVEESKKFYESLKQKDLNGINQSVEIRQDA